MPSIEIAGRTVLLDAEDIPLLLDGTWTVGGSGGKLYVRKSIKAFGKYCQNICLHRLIIDCPEGFVVDHINGDSLDNRRANLRVCIQAENSRNRKVHCNNSSGLKGVYLDAGLRGNPWRAQIRFQGKKFNLGRYKSPEEAHAAYCKASLEKHGDFARSA